MGVGKEIRKNSHSGSKSEMVLGVSVKISGLISYLQTRFRKLPQMIPADGQIILRQPVAVQDRTLQRLADIHTGKILLRHAVDIFIRPFPVHIVHQTVLEQSQRLMRPQSDQLITGEILQRLDGLKDAPDPPGQLSGTVDVVRLHFLRELLLRVQIKLHHRAGQRLRHGADRGEEAQHGAVEGAVNLLVGRGPGIVDVDDGRVAEKALR